MDRYEVAVVREQSDAQVQHVASPREQSVDGGFLRVNNNIHLVFLALAGVEPLLRLGGAGLVLCRTKNR